MKRVLLTAACMLAFALAASAQAPQQISVYVGGALSLPSSPDGFKDAYNTGYHGLVGLGYKVSPPFQVVGKIEYHNFGFDFDQLPGFDGGNTKMLVFGGDGRYSFGLPAAPIKPFAFGGLGFANVSYSDFSGEVTLAAAMNQALPDDQTKLYWNLGAGVEFKAGPAWSLFGQLRYVSVATEGDATTIIPITLGVKFF